MTHWLDTIDDGYEDDYSDMERDAREDESKSAEVTLADGRSVQVTYNARAIDADNVIEAIQCDGLEISHTLSPEDYQTCLDACTEWQEEEFQDCRF